MNELRMNNQFKIPEHIRLNNSDLKMLLHELQMTHIRREWRIYESIQQQVNPHSIQ